MDGKQNDVKIVNENDTVDVDALMDYEFSVDKQKADGTTETEIQKLSEFATMQEGVGLASIKREYHKVPVLRTRSSMLHTADRRSQQSPSRDSSLLRHLY